MHFATNGIMDYMVKLMLGAYQIAKNQDLSGIDRYAGTRFQRIYLG